MRKQHFVVHKLLKAFKNIRLIHMESETIATPATTTTTSSKPALFDNGFPSFSFQPIGYIDSVFKEKNGTPRQVMSCFLQI